MYLCVYKCGKCYRIYFFFPKPNHALYGSQPFYMALDEDGKASGVFLHNSNIMGKNHRYANNC